MTFQQLKQELIQVRDMDVLVEFSKTWDVEGLIDWVTFVYEYNLQKHEAEELLELTVTN